MINKERLYKAPIEGISLTFLLLISFLIRYFSASWTPSFPDSFTYLKLSQYIQEGRYYLDIWGRGEMIVKPIYSILSNFFSWHSTINIEFGATWVSLISGVMLTIPLFLLAKWIAGRVVAWISVVIVIVNPELIRYSTYILTESLYTFIFLVTLAAGYWMMKEKRQDHLWIFVGIITGLGLVSRDVAMIAIPIIVLWLSFLMFRSGERRRRIFLCVILFLAGIILFKSTYMLSISGKDVKPRPTSELIEKKLLTPDLRDSRMREHYFSSLTEDGTDYLYNQPHNTGKNAIQLIWEKKGTMIRNFLINLYGNVNILWKTFPTILFIFIFIGLVVNLVNYKSVLPRFYIISWFIIYILFYVLAGAYTAGFHSMAELRYQIPVFPLMFVWAGMGIVYVSDKVVTIVRSRIWQNGFLKPAVTLLLTLLIIAMYTPEIKERIYKGTKERQRINADKMLGESIRRSYPNSLIMTRLPSLPYYAGARWFMIPDEPVERVINFANYKGVELIYIDLVTAAARPQLAMLLRKDISIEGLMPVIKVPDPGDEELYFLAVYRVM